jgi:hypothetical protein
MLVAAQTEPYYFRVGSRSHWQGAGEVELASLFVASRESDDRFAKGGEDEEEIEIEADPLVYVGSDIGKSVPAMLYELCQRGRHSDGGSDGVGDGGGDDDHGNTFSCATVLGAGDAIGGEIDHRQGRDVDVFLVVLSATEGPRGWAVEFQSEGDLDTLGTLYDRSGRPLAHDDDGGSAKNFRIAEILDSGMYFVRVEGYEGAAGSYGLRIDAVPAVSTGGQ